MPRKLEDLTLQKIQGQMDDPGFLNLLIGAVPPRDAQQAESVRMFRVILGQKTRHSLPRELLRWSKYDKITDPYVVMLLKMEGERILHERPEFRHIKRPGFFDCDLDNMMEAVYFLNDYQSGNPEGIAYALTTEHHPDGHEALVMIPCHTYTKGNRTVRIYMNQYEHDEVEFNTWLIDGNQYRDCYHLRIEEEYVLLYHGDNASTRNGVTTEAPVQIRYEGGCMWEQLRSGMLGRDSTVHFVFEPVRADGVRVIDVDHHDAATITFVDEDGEYTEDHYVVDPDNDYAVYEDAAAFFQHF